MGGATEPVKQVTGASHRAISPACLVDSHRRVRVVRIRPRVLSRRNPCFPDAPLVADTKVGREYDGPRRPFVALESIGRHWAGRRRKRSGFRQPAPIRLSCLHVGGISPVLANLRDTNARQAGLVAPGGPSLEVNLAITHRLIFRASNRYKAIGAGFAGMSLVRSSASQPPPPPNRTHGPPADASPTRLRPTAVDAKSVRQDWRRGGYSGKATVPRNARSHLAQSGL